MIAQVNLVLWCHVIDDNHTSPEPSVTLISHNAVMCHSTESKYSNLYHTDCVKCHSPHAVNCSNQYPYKTLCSTPESIRAADNVHMFKRLLKTYFLTFSTDVTYSSPCCYFNCFICL